MGLIFFLLPTADPSIQAKRNRKEALRSVTLQAGTGTRALSAYPPVAAGRSGQLRDRPANATPTHVVQTTSCPIDNRFNLPIMHSRT